MVGGSTNALGGSAGSSALGGAAATQGSPGGTSSLASGGTGSGGTTSMDGAGAAGACGGATRTLLSSETFIDDFETEARKSGWYAFADNDVASSELLPSYVSDAAAGTTTSLHVAASAITPPPDGFGAGFGFNLVDPDNENCVDVSAFAGVSFWAKGSSGSEGLITFQIVHPATTPIAEGGDCETQCYQHPSKQLALSDAWQEYVVVWSDLTGSASLPGPILGFNLITAETDYEVWLDEVAFFGSSEP
jgi:hypothetical protein